LLLPDTVEIRGQELPLHYEVEETLEGPLGVVRVRLPEKMARTLVEEERPVLDRPLRFVVYRGKRGTVRANTLEELQDLLDRPWTPDELGDDEGPYRRGRDDGRHRDRAAHSRQDGRSPGAKRRGGREHGRGRPREGTARDRQGRGEGRSPGRGPASRKRRRG